MYLIVGVDPGTTTGIAALNLSGKIVKLYSSRDFGVEKVIEYLISSGRISIVASDVNPAPESVSKIATSLGSRLFLPKESLRVDEKIELTRNYKTEDSHQRDALAAALNAFNRFKNKIQKIDSLDLGDEVKHLVLQGTSIEKATLKLEKKSKKEEKVKPPQKPPEKILSEEQKKIKNLERQNRVLTGELQEKEREIKKLRDDILKLKRQQQTEIKKDEKIKSREYQIADLRREVFSLKGEIKKFEKLKSILSSIAKNELIPVFVFPENPNGYVLIKNKIGSDDEEKLKKVKFAFSESNAVQEQLRKKGVPYADAKNLQEFLGCFFIETKKLEELQRKKISLEKIIEEYRKGE